LRVEVFEEVPEDVGLANSWNRIAARMERPEIFYTWEWAMSASRAFAGTLRPLVLLVYEADQLRGIATLATGLGSHQEAFFLTASTADYCDFVSEPEERGEVLAAIFGELQLLGITDLVLANVPADSATLQTLPNVVRAEGFHCSNRAAYRCPVISLEPDSARRGVAQLAETKENPGLKSLAKLGCVKVTHLTGPAAEEDVPKIVRAHIARFMATHRVSPLLRPERRLFLGELASRLGRAGWLKISRLEVDGQPVAWNYGFQFMGCWFWYLPTFETKYERHSPGSCLLQLLVREASGNTGVKRLDFGLGGEPYKHRFANTGYETRYLELSRSSVRHVTSVGGYWLGAGAKKFPAIERQLRKTRDRARIFYERVHESGLGVIAGNAARRAATRIQSDDEILLFEASATEKEDVAPMSLAPLDWDGLAQAAIFYEDDGDTLQCLMRYGERLRRRRGPMGFGLQTPDGSKVHFLSIANVDGFHVAEIDYKLRVAGESGSGADPTGSAFARFGVDPVAPAMIFDCWTPAAHRGQGFYGMAVRQAACLLESQGRRAWIFSAAANEASIRGILKAGFIHRFSLGRKGRWVSSRKNNRKDHESALKKHEQAGNLGSTAE